MTSSRRASPAPAPPTPSRTSSSGSNPGERTPLLTRLASESATSTLSSSTKKRTTSSSSRRKACLIIGLLTLVSAIAVVVTLTLTGAASSIVLSFLSSLSALSTCSTCFTLLVPIRQLALLGDAAFTNTFTSLCIDLNIQPADICRGALERQGPAIAQSLRQIQPNKRTAAAFCSKIFGLCSSRGESIADLPSELFLPPNITHPHRHPLKPSGKRRKIVHISDVHIDRSYKEGTEANCGRVLCCRENLAPFRQADGKPYLPVNPAGPFGNPNCDAPYSLFKSMLEAIRVHASDAEFIVSTGDIASHAVWEESKESTSLDILEAYAIMRSALNMPVFGTLGNHDIAPVNLFAPSSNARAFQNTLWTYDTHYTAWRDWIGHQVNRSSFFDNVGSYAVDAPHMHMRVISLNTNYWSPDNFYAYATEYPPPDPEGILSFLMRELQMAESKGQHAIIIGHASPSTIFPLQSHYFDQIVQRYRSTIVAQLYGHTHSSDFAVGYSTPAAKTAEAASSVAFVSGALTPLGRSVNPGFRVYEVDEATGELWDWKEYYANITDPSFQQGPQWKVLYSARDLYGKMVGQPEHEPLRPAFWHRLSEVLEDSLPAFRRFIFNKYRGSRFATTRACRSEVCRRFTLCGLRRTRSEEKCGRINSPTIIEDEEDTTRDNGSSSPPSSTFEPSEAEIREELEETPRDFGFEQLLSGIVHRAKHGQLHTEKKKALHTSIMAKL
ncbi:sphingomyelin phosphodiesterase [Cystobasidium minutum MCA 4210]|uniref:sphingomyelin phosphodiesterase n=1 Tax=Cystobasidium minutum MCA 4210 TaxID=1397322 RepID=UPI0034CDA95F|eukprot:jgi/Rhomi1/189120/estExt_fgenesh1_pg.C_3_t20077